MSGAADAFVVAHRPAKVRLDPRRAYASLWEEEAAAGGVTVPTATVFLTNRECPFRCVMCDLWTHTLDEVVPSGAIPEQIRIALQSLPAARRIKLYNAGSFFDPAAVPPGDDEEIAAVVQPFERVVVESHPAFLAGPYGDRCVRFGARLDGQLEVAIGLETANPAVLARLNKRMTIDAFRHAAAFLARHRMALRVFVLLSPPYQPPGEAVEWACRSIDEAIAQGAAVCSILPTRGGNGALEALGPDFAPPRLRALEAVLEYGLSAAASAGVPRVFADLWDIERFFDCRCSPRRAGRLAAMNRVQRAVAPVVCDACASA